MCFTTIKTLGKKFPRIPIPRQLLAIRFWPLGESGLENTPEAGNRSSRVIRDMELARVRKTTVMPPPPQLTPKMKDSPHRAHH